MVGTFEDMAAAARVRDPASGPDGSTERPPMPSGVGGGRSGSVPRMGGRTYREYLLSAAWRLSRARLLALDQSGRSCRICPRGEPEHPVEVHHRTYARIGRERPGDLTTLCSECHRMVTEGLRRREHAVEGLPSLRDTPRVLPGRAPPSQMEG